jgi:hypothetical protein
MFISAGKGAAAINDGDSNDASKSAAAAKAAAAAEAIIQAVNAGRTVEVAQLLQRISGDALVHQITLEPSSQSLHPHMPSRCSPATPLGAVLTMTGDLLDNVADLSSHLTAAIRNLSRAPQNPFRNTEIMTSSAGAGAARVLCSGESTLMCSCASRHLASSQALIMKGVPVFARDRSCEQPQTIQSF